MKNIMIEELDSFQTFEDLGKRFQEQIIDRIMEMLEITELEANEVANSTLFNYSIKIEGKVLDLREVKNKLTPSGVDVSKITYLDITPEKQHHYWYGGQVAEIEYKDAKFSIEAIGDVNFTLFEKETGDQVFYVKDKNNSGELGYELSYYIKDDEELNLLLSGNHPKYECAIENNNWWECFIIIGDEFYDLMWCLDAYTITEAIEEVWEAKEEMYDHVKEGEV